MASLARNELVGALWVSSPPFEPAILVYEQIRPTDDDASAPRYATNVYRPDQPDPRNDGFDAEAFSRRVAEAEEQVRAQVPDIHPFDLHTILHAMFMPLDRRAFFLRKRNDGGYEF